MFKQQLLPIILFFLITIPTSEVNSRIGGMRRPTGPKLTDLVLYLDGKKANSTTSAAYPSGTGCSTWYDIKGTHNATLTNFDCTTSGWLGSPWILRDAAIDDIISIADHNNLSFTDGSGNDRPFTLELWVNATEMASNRTLIGKLTSNTTGGEYALYLSAGERLQGYAIGANWNTTRISAITNTGAGNIVPTGVWSHVAMTYDGSEAAAGIKIYINGAITTVTTSTLGTYTGMANETSPLRIGQWTNVSFLSEGSYAIVRVYKVELTANEIRHNCRIEQSRFGVTTCS